MLAYDDSGLLALRIVSKRTSGSTEATGWEVKREMKKWEKRRLEELKVKQVDKLVQTVRPTKVEVSPVGVQTDQVGLVAPVVTCIT